MRANDKMQIINNFNSIETLIFNFEQISQEKTERGKCYLKRPHFLKCLYNDEKGKELIINRKNLVVYHKKYNRKYYYPASKSYFLNILNKNKFKNLILDSRIFSKNNFEIVNLNNEKGKNMPSLCIPLSTAIVSASKRRRTSCFV